MGGHRRTSSRPGPGSPAYLPPACLWPTRGQCSTSYTTHCEPRLKCVPPPPPHPWTSVLCPGARTPTPPPVYFSPSPPPSQSASASSRRPNRDHFLQRRSVPRLGSRFATARCRRSDKGGKTNGRPVPDLLTYARRLGHISLGSIFFAPSLPHPHHYYHHILHKDIRRHRPRRLKPQSWACTSPS